MNDYFQNYNEALPSTSADFHVTESYRLVRIGLFCLLAGYVVLAPGLALTLVQSTLRENGEPNALLLLGVVALLLLGALMLVLGGLLLLKSPQANERAVIRKVLIAYGIAIGCLIAARVFGFGGLEIIRKIAQAYGLWFLINYFEVLAANRENVPLQSSSRLLNRCYIIGVLAILILSLFGGVLGVLLVVITIFGFAFYGLWLRTIWLAIKSTRFILSDSGRFSSFVKD